MRRTAVHPIHPRARKDARARKVDAHMRAHRREEWMARTGL